MGGTHAKGAIFKVVAWRCVEGKMHCLRARDWEYVGEGNLHLVCRYNPTDGSEYVHFKGKVLRLTKEVDYVIALRSQELSSTISTNILNPFFGSDIVVESELVPLPFGFISELSVLVHECRPALRRQKSLNEEAKYGEVMFDATRLFRVASLSNHVEAVSVDLKVKCGLKSSSPFVTPGRSIKQEYGRFHVMQLYKSVLSGAEVSTYDPCDLCSGCKARVGAALKCLATTPQNNFSIQSQSQGQDQTSSGIFSNADVLVDALSTILSSEHETVLQRLQLLQSFDLIDIEGAACIFERLKKQLSSSVDALEVFMCDSFRDFDYSLLTGLEEAIGGVRGAGNVVSETLETLLSLRTSRHDEDRQLRALEWVETLTVQDSVALLQLWLLALAAKDTSLVVALAVVEPSVLLTQVATANCGFINLTTMDERKVVIAYNLALVDFGLKHPRKCWSLENREIEIMKTLSLETNSTNDNPR